MGRTALLLAILLGGALLPVSCGKGALPERDDGLVRMTFSIRVDGEGTRTTGEFEANEAKISGWALMLYQDGRLMDWGSITPGGSLSRTLPTGVYEAYAVANFPTQKNHYFRAQNMVTINRLTEEISLLGDNAEGSFVMAGKAEIVVREDDTSPQTIPVKRLVCKTGIRKISISETAPAQCRNSFVLKGIYLTNCVQSMSYLSDTPAADLPTERSSWYNPMGFQSDGTVDPILSDTGIGAAVTPEAPYTVAHYFYCYPNTTPETADTRSADWARRCTRMVIEAEIGGKTCYYPVTLASMKRNTTYIVEEAIIRSMGSEDPEGLVPGSVDVVFSTDVTGWSPEYVIVEES